MSSRRVALLVLVSWCLMVPTSKAAEQPRIQSFGEWTAGCTYDDMEGGVTLCSVMSSPKEVNNGFISGRLAIIELVGSGGTFMLNAVISGAIPSHSGPIFKVDDNAPEGGAVQLGEASYDVNAGGMKYSYLLKDTIEAEAKVGKLLRVRLPLDVGNLETSFELSGYSRANALVQKWETGEHPNHPTPEAQQPVIKHRHFDFSDSGSN